MKLLLVTTKYTSEEQGKWLTNELADEFVRRGWKVTVVALSWLPSDLDSSTVSSNNITLIRVKLPSIFYAGSSIATIAKVLLFPLAAIPSIIKHASNCKLAIFNTPCITIGFLPIFLKFFYKARTLLVAWDFFPYYLKDLNVAKSPLKIWLLAKAEGFFFKSFDQIGCMSPKNIKYLCNNYSMDLRRRSFILPLWVNLASSTPSATKGTKGQILAKYSIPLGKKIAIYGGAITFVQSLENLLAVAEISMRLSTEIHYVVIGQGESLQRLIKLASDMKLANLTFINSVPRDEYCLLLSASDVSLVFLSPFLEVPSFPSKTLDYFRYGVPVVAALDAATDYGMIIEHQAKAGFSFIASDHYAIFCAIKQLCSDSSLRLVMGNNAKKFLIDNHGVGSAYMRITSIFDFEFPC